VVRLVILAGALGLGVALLLTAVSATNAVSAQNDRYAWLDTGAKDLAHRQGIRPARSAPDAGTSAGAISPASSDPLWGLITADEFSGQVIYRADVAATGATSPVPPGLPRDPGPGQYYASPALAKLLRSTPAGELADRYPGHQVGLIGEPGLPSPNSLLIVIGHSAAQMSHLPGAAIVTSLNATAPSGCGAGGCVVRAGIGSSFIDLILSVVALSLLLPVLIFIATATRLSAARREQRFAAMRLVGATRRQISVIAAMESTLAALAGVAAGFGLFFVLRVPLAAIPFTGEPFFPGELSLSLPDIAAVAVGVPAAAGVVARLALRRVNISPLGVARRVTPKPPRARRVILLLAGLADLGFFVVHGRPASIPGQILAFVPGFALIMIGLMSAGPWLTMAGARVMVRRVSRPGALIAARRLADDPQAGFRAVSGLVLALFITTVAVAVITTQNTKRLAPVGGAAASNVLAEQFGFGPGQGNPAAAGTAHGTASGFSPAAAEAVVGRLRRIRGVQGVVELRDDPGLTMASRQLGIPAGFPAVVVSCPQIATAPALGRCPVGAAAVKLSPFLTSGHFGGRNLTRITWPAADVTARQLGRLRLYGIAVATNGSQSTVEQARTVLERAYPTGSGSPTTFGEDTATQNAADNAYQQLADVVILTSLAIAGCTLAASVAAGLADRKRPFSLLRLTGARLGMLRRVIALESGIPLLAAATVAIGTGFAASAMFADVQLAHPLVAPDAAYYVITAGGIALALGIIAATFPLLRRLTRPEAVRNE